MMSLHDEDVFFQERDEDTEPRDEPDSFQEKKKFNQWLILWFFIIVAILAASAYWAFFERSKKTETGQRAGVETVEAPVPAAAGQSIPIEEPEPAEVIPETVLLAESDTTLREQARFLSSDSILASILSEKDMIRRFAAVTDNIARGQTPRPLIEFLSPKEHFQVIRKAGKVYADPASFSRYNALSGLIDSLDEKACIDLLLRFRPQLQEAYNELGSGKAEFFSVLRVAAGQVLSVPVPETPFQLEEHLISYIYVDEQLEALSDAQKHFLRMGPENLKKIQKKLISLLDTLNKRTLEKKEK